MGAIKKKESLRRVRSGPRQRCCNTTGGRYPRYTLQWENVRKKSRVWGRDSGPQKPQLSRLKCFRPTHVCHCALLCTSSVHGEQVTRYFYNSVTRQDTMCTYVTSQLFLRRRFPQPPRAHHIPPAHCCCFRRSLSADFGSGSFVFGSVFSYLKGGKRRLHKAETIKFRSGKLECWVVSNSSKYRHRCVWSVLTDRAALEQSRPDFPRVVSQIKGFALDSEFGVTAVWRSSGDPNGDVVGVKKRTRGAECGEVFCCYMERLMLIPVSVDAISSLRDRVEMSYSGPMHSFSAFAKFRPIFALKAAVSQSFPTSLLPWFLNYDWQGGSVSPSTHSPQEHGSVKLRRPEVDVSIFQNKYLAYGLMATTVYNTCYYYLFVKCVFSCG